MCGLNEIACESEDGRCYDLSYRCDGIPDCVQSVKAGPPLAVDEQGCDDVSGMIKLGQINYVYTWSEQSSSFCS